MPDYLLVPAARQERAVHEKARARRRGELQWIRDYLLDEAEDAALWGETATTRLLDRLLLKLAAKGGDWRVPYDVGLISHRLGLERRWVRQAIPRLVELGRFELVHVEQNGASGGQASLFGSTEGSDLSTSEDGVKLDLSSTDARVTHSDFAQPSLAKAEAASRRLAQRREEKKEPSSKATVPREPARKPLPLDSRSTSPLVGRLVANACRNDPASVAIVQRYAHGLPEHALGRAIESLRTRQPRPDNPAGYVVSTLKALRAELGLPAVARIDREPPL